MFHSSLKPTTAIVMLLCIGLMISSCVVSAPSGQEAPIQSPTEPSQTPFPEGQNSEKTAFFALPAFALPDPGANAIVLSVTPLLESPTATEDELLNNPNGVVIGYLQAFRDLPLSDDQVPVLPANEYQVKVSQSQMVFINSNGEELAPPSIMADVRTLERDVLIPEVIITVQDVCYSWHQLQVCTEPSPNQALTQSELEDIQEQMSSAVDTLAVAGLLTEEEINVEGTIPDMDGNTALDVQQASFLAAPTVAFPFTDGDVPVDGALLGVVHAVLPIDPPGYPTIPVGSYAVTAVQRGDNEWEGHFERADGFSVDIPAVNVEVRGQIEEPMAIIVGIRMGLCFFEC